MSNESTDDQSEIQPKLIADGGLAKIVELTLFDACLT